jgi:hypothetical protein
MRHGHTGLRRATVAADECSLICTPYSCLCNLSELLVCIIILLFKRPYPVRKEGCCSHEQNQSRPHPPHPMVLCQGVFCKMYRARVERLLCKIDATPLDMEGAVWIDFAHGSSRASCAQDTVSLFNGSTRR